MRPHVMRQSVRPPATAHLLIMLGLALSFAVFTAPAAHATPPPWAPAHGYRAKQAHAWGPYLKYDGACTWTQLDTALGAALGGYVGSQIGAGDGRAIATVGGVVLGALIGHKIGEYMDGTDQYCAGQALSYAPAGAPVVWVDPRTDWHYRFMPQDRYTDDEGRECRHFSQIAEHGNQARHTHGVACRETRGSWYIVD